MATLDNILSPLVARTDQRGIVVPAGVAAGEPGSNLPNDRGAETGARASNAGSLKLAFADDANTPAKDVADEQPAGDQDGRIDNSGADTPTVPGARRPLLDGNGQPNEGGSPGSGAGRLRDNGTTTGGAAPLAVTVSGRAPEGGAGASGVATKLPTSDGEVDAGNR